MLVNLGHESQLRELYGFPPPASLWGPKARCCWARSGGPSEANVRELERAPDSVFKRLRLTGPACLTLVDDLLAHAKFGAAMNLAGYLAAMPPAANGRDRAVFDAGVLAFLRLKEAQAAIEGGFYARARALLVQLEALTDAVPDGRAGSLVRANVAMLWGRLLQLLWLSRRSLEFLDQAADIFTPQQLPPGFRLLRYRSNLRDVDPEELEREKGKLRGKAGDGGLFAGLAEHYVCYLLGRVKLREPLNARAAEREFRAASRSLARRGHGTAPDPIRRAYATLGLGQALVAQGSVLNSAALVDEGLRQIVQAQWQFEQEGNPHGEYLAHREHSEASSRGPGLDDEARLRALKADYRLAVRSQVPRFQLESGLAYAKALYDYGRPNRVAVLIDEMKHIVDDPLAAELTRSDEWEALMRLERKTEAARENAVDPQADWGISVAAQQEGAYVRRMAASGSLVAVSGPPGSGRRLLVSRIASAREQSAPVVLDARTRPSVVAVVGTHLKAGTPVILHNIDLWDERTQVEVLDAARATKGWPSRVYLTFRSSTPRDSALGDRQSPNLSSALLEGGFTIKPLNERREDTLLLARGYLVRGLAERMQRGRRSQFNPKTVVFTTDACEYIRERYRDVRTLSRHMRDLAHRLNERDFLVARDGRRRVPEEVIRKLIEDVPSAQGMPGREQAPMTGDRSLAPISGVDLLRADEATLQKVAVHYKGKVATAARAYGVAQATFRKSLQDRRLLAPWYEWGGAKRT